MTIKGNSKSLINLQPPLLVSTEEVKLAAYVANGKVALHEARRPVSKKDLSKPNHCIYDFSLHHPMTDY